MVRIDILGRKFKRLTVLRHVKDGYWECLCKCGNMKIISGSSLRSGGSKSCGCLRSQVTSRRNKLDNPGVIKHGMTGTPEWSAYKDARRRCIKRNYKRYYDYGGRGIKFLFKSFEQFFDEIGPRPKGKTLDRIDNDGHYELGNIRWATTHEQRINQRKKCAS